jgi:hypothetical protein
MLRKISCLLLLLALGCKRSNETHLTDCKYPLQMVAGDVIFSGFTPADLDTIIVNTYSSDNTFKISIKSDTLTGIISYTSGGLAYYYDTIPHAPKILDITVDLYSDKQILVKALNKIYNVHAIYTGDTVIEVMNNGNCDDGLPRLFIKYPVVLQVNGIVDTTVEYKYAQGSFHGRMLHP